MRYPFRSTVGVLAAAGLIGALAGCSAGGSSGATVIRAGWVPTVHSTHWATTDQFVDDGKVTIELQPFKTNNEMYVAMQSGSLDMMTMGYNNTATALAREKVDYSYVAGVSVGGTRLLVGKDSGIKDWADLKGKNVGSARGSTQYQQLVLAAAANGVDVEKDTEFSNIGGAPDMVLALQRGDVDAVSVWEPSASEAIERGVGVEVPAMSDDFYTDSFELNSGLAVSNEFIDDEPEVVTEVLTGYRKAWQQTTGDEKWWVSEFKKLSSSDDQALDRSLENVDPVVEVDRGAVRELSTRLADSGLVEKDVSAEMDKLIDTSFLEKAEGADK